MRALLDTLVQVTVSDGRVIMGTLKVGKADDPLCPRKPPLPLSRALRLRSVWTDWATSSWAKLSWIAVRMVRCRAAVPQRESLPRPACPRLPQQPSLPRALSSAGSSGWAASWCQVPTWRRYKCPPPPDSRTAGNAEPKHLHLSPCAWSLPPAVCWALAEGVLAGLPSRSLAVSDGTNSRPPTSAIHTKCKPACALCFDFQAEVPLTLGSSLPNNLSPSFLRLQARETLASWSGTMKNLLATFCVIP